MDCCLSYAKPKPCFPILPSLSPRRPITFQLRVDRRPFVVVGSSTNSSTKREFGGLNAPLQPRSPAGTFLTGVLLDDRDNFQVAARKELERLSGERDEAVARFRLSIGSDEASLHRKIAGFKKHECGVEVEDIMYMLIFHKFFEMGVNLVPRLSKCLYNGRLEIWPSKDWELESIHSFEVLVMVKEHINDVVGWRANSNITHTWATTEIQRADFCKLYVASILYGYFLKSACLRHSLEWGLDQNFKKNQIPSKSDLSSGACSQRPVSEMFSLGSEYIAFGCISSQKSTCVGREPYNVGKKREDLRCYVMGLDEEMIQMCARPRSNEAVNLIERHSCALFEDGKAGELISTSFASLKRLALEAVAFGSFLWDSENYVNAVYMLDEN